MLKLLGPVALGDKNIVSSAEFPKKIFLEQIFVSNFLLNAVALGSDNLIFMPKTSIKLSALFSVSYCFFFCAAAAEASVIKEVGSGGNRP